MKKQVIRDRLGSKSERTDHQTKKRKQDQSNSPRHLRVYFQNHGRLKRFFFLGPFLRSVLMLFWNGNPFLPLEFRQLSKPSASHSLPLSRWHPSAFLSISPTDRWRSISGGFFRAPTTALSQKAMDKQSGKKGILSLSRLEKKSLRRSLFCYPAVCAMTRFD